MTKEQLLASVVVTDGIPSISDDAFNTLLNSSRQGYMSQSEVDLLKKQHKAELQGVKHSNMLDIALLGVNTHDATLLKSLLDLKKLKFGDKVEGLDEQITALRESKPYLFKADENKPPTFGGAEPTDTGAGAGVDTEEEAYFRQLMGGM